VRVRWCAAQRSAVCSAVVRGKAVVAVRGALGVKSYHVAYSAGEFVAAACRAGAARPCAKRRVRFTNHYELAYGMP